MCGILIKNIQIMLFLRNNPTHVPYEYTLLKKASEAIKYLNYVDNYILY